MTATPVLERAPRKMFRQRASRPTTMDEERREVLESVRCAMRQSPMEPSRNAACRFLLRHLTAIPPAAASPGSPERFLWMAFFRDPGHNPPALRSEVPPQP